MNSNNAFLLFLKETFLRFSTKSPKYFQVLAFVSGAVVIITGLPEFLAMLDVHLPALWSEHLNHVIAICSRVSLLVSLLTTQSPATSITVNGNVLKETNEKKLPFTASQEEKALVKNDQINSLTVVEAVKQ